MSEIFTIQPKSQALARRRRVTLTASLVAHAVGFALVAFVILKPAKVVTEPTTIPAFVMEAPAPKAAASAPKAAQPEAAKPKPEPSVTPTPVSEPTQMAATEPPPATTSVSVGQASG